MTGKQANWDEVYGARSEEALTWFEATPSPSLELVRAHLRPGKPFIDIGAGASASSIPCSRRIRPSHYAGPVRRRIGGQQPASRPSGRRHRLDGSGHHEVGAKPGL